MSDSRAPATDSPDEVIERYFAPPPPWWMVLWARSWHFFHRVTSKRFLRDRRVVVAGTQEDPRG